MNNLYQQIKKSILRTKPDFNSIVIVGKGESLKDLKADSISNSLIININDSELVIKGHLTLFSAPRVLSLLKKYGYKSGAYITNQNMAGLLPGGIDYFHIDFQPSTYEGVEQIASFFEEDNTEFSEFLLLSGIKLALSIQKYFASEWPIYLVGFDFDIEKRDFFVGNSQHDSGYREILFKTQKSYYLFAQKYLQEKIGVKLHHVGDATFSSLTVSEFNQKCIEAPVFYKKSSFDNNEEYKNLLKKCQSQNHVIVVAELTNNHIGCPDRLAEMIRLAKRAGADMVKIQKRDVNTFYTQAELDAKYNSPFGSDLKSYREGVELDESLMSVLISECERNEIIWFSSVLDYGSFSFLKKYNPPLLKLPSTISNHRIFLKKVGGEFLGDLVISTGFTDLEYEEFVLKNFCADRNLFLLQCTSSYPAPPETCQIAVVRHYEALGLPNLFPGYSSHDVGSLGCMMAVAAGAKMIEKHVKLGDLDWVHFDGVALDLSNHQFDDFVKDVRKASIMCGSKVKKIHNAEHHKYRPNKNNF